MSVYLMSSYQSWLMSSTDILGKKCYDDLYMYFCGKQVSDQCSVFLDLYIYLLVYLFGLSDSHPQLHPKD